MGKLSKYRVLAAGVLSPFVAVFLNVIVNGMLMRFSAHPETNWRFRLGVSTVVMAIPFVLTLVLVVKETSPSTVLPLRENWARYRIAFSRSRRKACERWYYPVEARAELHDAQRARASV